MNFFEINPSVEQAVDPVVMVDDALIDRTLARARLAPRNRARILLHDAPDQSLHEMLIALPSNSCEVPHINFKSGKSFHVIRGEMVVFVFASDGRQLTAYRLKAGDVSYGKMVRLNKPAWHTIIPLSPHAVFIETILGPFTGNQFAPWSPAGESSPRWPHFVKTLQGIAGTVGTVPLGAFFDI